MQSRRDQLQAYRFLVRRAVGALVTGEPDVAESPMRRLTVTTVSGVMIAILIAAGFGVYGLIRPGPSTAWKSEGAVVVDPQGTRYVYLQGTLYPTTNYASAVLARTTARGAVSVVRVSNKSIASVPRGNPIGIPGLPDSLPTSAAGLVHGPWSVCSSLTTVASQPHLTVSVGVGFAGVSSTDTSGVTLAADQALYVQTADQQHAYLLWHGKRITIDPDASAVARFQQSPIYVGDAFIAGIPAASAAIGPLQIPGAGQSVPFTVGGRSVRAGDLVTVGAGSSAQSYVVVSDGFSPLTPFLAALARLDPGRREIRAAVTPTPSGSQLRPDLPTSLPTLAPAQSSATQLCDVYDQTTATWTVTAAAPPSPQPLLGGRPTQSTTGQADSVRVRANSAALVVSSTPALVAGMKDNRTRILVATPGERFTVDDPAAVLASFGYDTATPVPVPAEVLAIIPAGPDLDRSKLSVGGR